MRSSRNLGKKLANLVKRSLYVIVAVAQLKESREKIRKSRETVPLWVNYKICQRRRIVSVIYVNYEYYMEIFHFCSQGFLYLDPILL